MLGSEPDKNDPAFTFFNIDHGWLVGQIFFPPQPTALEEISFLVADNGLVLFVFLAGSDLEYRAGPEQNQAL